MLWQCWSVNISRQQSWKVFVSKTYVGPGRTRSNPWRKAGWKNRIVAFHFFNLNISVPWFPPTVGCSKPLNRRVDEELLIRDGKNPKFWVCVWFGSGSGSSSMKLERCLHGNHLLEISCSWMAPWKNRMCSATMKLRKLLIKQVTRQNI